MKSSHPMVLRCYKIFDPATEVAAAQGTSTIFMIVGASGLTLAVTRALEMWGSSNAGDVWLRLSSWNWCMTQIQLKIKSTKYYRSSKNQETVWKFTVPNSETIPGSLWEKRSDKYQMSDVDRILQRCHLFPWNFFPPSLTFNLGTSQ